MSCCSPWNRNRYWYNTPFCTAWAVASRRRIICTASWRAWASRKGLRSTEAAGFKTSRRWFAARTWAWTSWGFTAGAWASWWFWSTKASRFKASWWRLWSTKTAGWFWSAAKAAGFKTASALWSGINYVAVFSCCILTKHTRCYNIYRYKQKS